MSSTIFPCECEIRYDDSDKVLSIRYCDKHEKNYNEKLSLDENADNLLDVIVDDVFGENTDK